MNYEKYHYESGHYWKLSDVFNAELLAVLDSAFNNIESNDVFSGKRDTNSYRSFVSHNNMPQMLLFDTPHVRQFFTSITGADCMNGALRIELCVDGQGFFLDNHIDIPEKIITMQTYIGDGDYEWGTDIFNDQEYSHTVPFKHNTGWVSAHQNNVVHGVRKNKITSTRRSVIINYVTDSWNHQEQLFNYDMG